MNIKDYLSKEEISRFTARSDKQAWRTVILNWLLIIAIFAITAKWTNPLTIFLAVVFLGGRQLALAVLVHECGHKTLFATAKLNETVGYWFAAAPILQDQDQYAKMHLRHHRTAGTDQDPDLPNYQAYPIDKASFKRKIIRDLSGQTGIKLLSALFINATKQKNEDGTSNKLSLAQEEGLVAHSDDARRRALIMNGLMILSCALFGEVWLYLLWVAAFITSYMLIIRLRQIAEHAAVPDLFSIDPRDNTRTTYGNLLERLLLCPNNVNYHLEHHIMASVPCYHLKAFHQLLKERGAYSDSETIAPGYLSVFKQVVV